MSTAALIPPLAPSPHDRFLRVAGFARALILVGAVLLVLNTVYSWVRPDYAVATIREETGAPVLGPLIPQTRLAAGAWDLASIVAPLVALAHLWRVFGEYARSRVFSVRALTGLRSFSRWMLATAVLTPVFRAGMSVIATWQNGHGQRHLIFRISSDDYMNFLFGIVVLAISSVMVEAARIAADNEGFV